MKGMITRKALLWVLLPTLVLGVSCERTDEVLSESVRFSMSASGDKETRTAYSGDGTKDAQGLLTKERIDWEVNDLVTIYSPEAMKTDWSHYADYKVTSVSTHDASYVTHATGDLMSHAEVVASDGGKGLTWEVGTNHFYGMYPSKAMFSSTDDGYSWIAMNEKTMKATIPADQTGRLTWTGLTGTGNIVGTPDMRYAWMFSNGATGTKGQSDPVHLVFYPKFTAFEFTIGSGENDSVTLSSFKLETLASGAYVAGNFSLDGDTGAVTVNNDAARTNNVTFTFPTGTVVTPSKSLTFTVFALPKDLTKMRITFTGTEIGTRTLDLNTIDGTALDFNGCWKYRIYGLRFPNLLIAVGEDILWDLEAHGEPINWY